MGSNETNRIKSMCLIKRTDLFLKQLTSKLKTIENKYSLSLQHHSLENLSLAPLRSLGAGVRKIRVKNNTLHFVRAHVENNSTSCTITLPVK